MKRSILLLFLLLEITVYAQINLDINRAGIGVDIPESNLHVFSTDLETDVLIENNNAATLILRAGSPTLRWQDAVGEGKASINWQSAQFKFYSSPPVMAPPPLNFSFTYPTLNMSEERKVGINMGLIGAPTEALDVNGRIKVGNSADTVVAAGTIRYNPSTEDFEGFDGNEWRSLTQTNTWGIATYTESQNHITSSRYFYDSIGFSVDVFEDIAIIGAPGNDDEADDAGAAFIFELVDGEWQEQAKLTASDAAAGDKFGYSVSISGNYAVVGAFLDDHAGPASGSAYVFYYDGSSWAQQDKLTATDADAGDAFGRSVAISGDNVIIGAPNDSDVGPYYGAAYLFSRNGVFWNQQQKLLASNPLTFDQFGTSVSISGDYCVVGGLAQHPPAFAGVLNVFFFNGSSWVFSQELQPSSVASGSNFGWSVDINGDYIISGSPNKRAAWVFHKDGGSWSEQARLEPNDFATGFGVSVSLSGSYAIVGASYANSETGSSYLFDRASADWRQLQKFTASDGDPEDYFGHSVSISGSNILIGAPQGDLSLGDAGCFYSFNR